MFRHDEQEGYPVQAVVPTRTGALSAIISAAICRELSDSEEFSLPSEVMNYRPDLLPGRDVLLALYARLVREEGTLWDEDDEAIDPEAEFEHIRLHFERIYTERPPRRLLQSTRQHDVQWGHRPAREAPLLERGCH